MQTNDSIKLYDLLLYIVVVFAGIIATLISILYKNIIKNIRDLWSEKEKHDDKITKNSEHIAVFKALIKNKNNDK